MVRAPQSTRLLGCSGCVCGQVLCSLPQHPTPTSGCVGAAPHSSSLPDAGVGWEWPSCFPSTPPIPHQQQREGVRPQGGRASSAGRPRSLPSVPGSQPRECRTPMGWVCMWSWMELSECCSWNQEAWVQVLASHWLCDLGHVSSPL